MAPKVVMAAGIGRNAEVAEGLQKAGCEVLVIPAGHAGQPHFPTAEEIEAYWRYADAFVMSGRDMVTREAMEASPSLRVGASMIIGTENIDVKAASDLGIILGYGAVPENLLGVAEAVVMLAAALVKHLPLKWSTLREGGWRVDSVGNMMRGRTIGLVGFGNIGRAVAARLHGWELDLLTADPYVDAPAAAALNVRLVDLDTLLRQSDVVSVSVTLTEETRGLIGQRELDLMKPGAYFINTSRGAVVDEAALMRAVDSHLGGAAIDTWEREPTNLESPLRDHPKVIATGHNVGHSEEVYAALGPAAIENILYGLRGEPPPYLRNPEALPAWRERLRRLGNTPAEV